MKFLQWFHGIQQNLLKSRFNICFSTFSETKRSSIVNYCSLQVQGVLLRDPRDCQHQERGHLDILPGQQSQVCSKEGLDQIENTPEIAAVDDDAGLGELNSTLETSAAVATPPPPAQKKKNTETPASKKNAKTETPKTETKAAKSEQKVSKAAATPKATVEPPPVKSTPRGEKRKAAAAVDTVSEKSAKKDESDKSAKKAAVEEPEDTTAAGKTSRSGRVIKPKKFGTETTPGSPAKNADSADNSVSRFINRCAIS